MLRNDLDLDQLDAQLSSGTVELRNLLLDCDYLNEQLVSRGLSTGNTCVWGLSRLCWGYVLMAIDTGHT